MDGSVVVEALVFVVISLRLMEEREILCESDCLIKTKHCDGNSAIIKR